MKSNLLKISIAAATITMLIGMMAAIGWLIDNDFLKSVIPGAMSMKFNAGLCFFIAGLTLLLKLDTPVKASEILTSSLSVIILLVSVLTVSQDIFAVNLGIDEFFITDTDRSISNPAPGRMSPIAAFCFSLIAIAFLLMPSKRTALREIAQISLHLVSLLAFIGMVGYLYDIPAFYKLSFLTSMAVHTTVALFSISLGASLVNSDRGVTNLFTGNLIGNAVARKLFPQVLAVGLVFTFLRIAAHRYNLVNVEFGIALFGVSFILVILFLLWKASNELNEIDLKRTKAEDSLFKIETFLNSTPDPIVIIDEKAVIQLVNHQVLKVFGYDKSELPGKQIEILLAEPFKRKQKNQPGDFFKLSQANASVQSLELSARKKDRSEFPVEISLSQIKLEHVTWASVSIRDITERKTVEARLKEYQYFFNNSMDFSCIANTEGYFEVINPNFEKYLGYSSKELVSDQFINFVHPDDKEATLKEVEKLAAGAITINFVNRYRKKDGSYLWFDWNTQPNPSTGKLYAIARDITERKKSEEKFRGLLESAPDAIVIVNSTGAIELVNAQTEKLFGYNRSELLGSSIDILLPDRYKNNHSHNVLTYFGNPKSRPMGKGLELFGKKKDRSEFPVEISLSPLETEHGTWVSAAIRDVTDRKRFEQHIQEANRLKSEFLANMSHELRTPLNGIIGFSEFLIDKKAGTLNEKQQEYLNDILNSGMHLLHLINDILDLSKIESGKMELFIETFSLKDAISEVCSVISGITKKKNTNLKVDIARDLKNVSFDKQKFKQVLYNLLSNAVKFTHEGGKVEIIAQTVNGNLSVQVRDNGIGISAEGINRLFMPFVQLDSSVSRKQDGTGLGLSLTKKMVELHGGSISVQSEPGKGSAFTVVWPQPVSKANNKLKQNHESSYTDR